MPGLLRGVARTAVVAGTATAVSNRVSRRQANRWAAQDQQQYDQQQYAQQQQYAPPPQPAPAAPAVPRPKRPTNPFLSQDPEARARRLARALVSDIVVYHPAKRRDGLRDGSLKLLFEEEIRKSWDEYVDQVGKQLADSTTFFTDALNEILADGQPVFP